MKNTFFRFAAVIMAAIMVRAPVCGTNQVAVHAEDSSGEDASETTEASENVVKLGEAPDPATFSPDQKGSLTLRYFDDSEETMPVAGAKFKIYQVASIGRDGDENGAYIPLQADLDFTGLTRKNISRSVEADTSEEAASDLDIQEADKYEKKVVNAYELNPELGQVAEISIGDDGTGKAEELTAGAYLVTETETPRYHIKSIPFLVSVPETNADGNGWNLYVVADPKANVAGDLKVEKILEGDFTNKDKEWSFKLTIPENALQTPYKILNPDGTTGFVSNGDVVKLKGGQSFTICDLPENSDYSITEVEANTDHYTTTYKNESGKIVGKSEQDVSVTNKRSKKDVLTGVTRNPILMASGIGAALMLILLIASLRKERKKTKTQ